MPQPARDPREPAPDSGGAGDGPPAYAPPEPPQSLAALSLEDSAIDWPYGPSEPSGRSPTAAGPAPADAGDERSDAGSVAGDQRSPIPARAPGPAEAKGDDKGQLPPPPPPLLSPDGYLDPIAAERTTYQYALRYAVLLDADNAQLAARTLSVSGKRPVPAAAAAAAVPTATAVADGAASGFHVKAAGRASGTPNHNNRTPTLVIPSRRPGAARSGGSGGSPQDGRARSRSWKSSLLELGDSAARRIKAEIGAAGRRRSPPKPGGGSPRAGALPPAIVKAVAAQLRTAAGAPSLHPLTQACYAEMAARLRAREHGDAPGECGSLDDLLALFADVSRAICSQNGIINGADIDRTVDSQADRFVKLLRAVLQAKAPTSREAGQALIRLDDYPDHAAANGQPTAAAAASSSSSGGGSRPISIAASAHPAADAHHPPAAAGAHSPLPARPSSYAAPGSPPAPAAGPASQLATDWLGRVFGVPEDEHSQLVAELRREVNQETAVRDLRTCLQVLKQDVYFAGKPENFRTPQAYRVWKDREITLLEQLIHSYTMRPSYMSGEQLGAGRLRGEGATAGDAADGEIAAAFEYIPTNAAMHYLTLIQKAVAHDIVDALRPGTPDAIVPLSAPANELLKQLVIAWRISASYRDTCYLDVVNAHYEQGDLPMSYLLDAFGRIERIVHLINPQDWQIAHYQYLLDTQSQIEYRALDAVRDVIEGLDHQRPEGSTSLKRLLRHLIINDVDCPALLNRPMPNIAGRRSEVVAVLEPSILYRFECLTSQCFSEDVADAASLEGYAQLAVMVLRDSDRCARIFADALFEDGDRRFDIPGIVAETEIRHFFVLLQQHLAHFGYGVGSASIEAVLELCKSLARIRELYARYSDCPLEGVDDQRLFKSAVSTWLANIDRDKLEWATNAIRQDSAPRALDVGKHSTSVIDLVTCFSQQVATVQRIRWPDAETKAWFLTNFMKYVDLCFEVYSKVMMKGFLECLDPSAAAAAATASEAPRGNGWGGGGGGGGMRIGRKYKEQPIPLSAATQAALATLDQCELPPVRVEACTKLNNLAIARDKLHELHKDLGISETMEALGGDSRAAIRDAVPDVYLVSFKVIRAEGLELYKGQYDHRVDKSARPYVTLAQTRQTEAGVTKRQRFADTREIPMSTAGLRWNQSLEWRFGSREELTAPLEVRICTRAGPKALGFREKTRARAFFALPSRLVGSIDNSIDVVLDMEPAGHLLMQVTIDGEHDDAEYYAGRMFRALGRTLSDMQQRLVEHVAVVVREYLRMILVAAPTRYRASRVIGAGHRGIDRGIDRSIQFLKRGGHQAPATVRVTHESCCEELIPLIDYLEDNLHTLFIHLYEETANGVIARVWGEVLVTLEDILLPPLRGPSKGVAKSLTESDLANIYDCIEFFKWYFGGGNDRDGIPMDVLESRKYRELMEVRCMYFMMTHELMAEYMAEMRRSAQPQPQPQASGRPPLPLDLSPLPLPGGAPPLPQLPRPQLPFQAQPPQLPSQPPPTPQTPQAPQAPQASQASQAPQTPQTPQTPPPLPKRPNSSQSPAQQSPGGSGANGERDAARRFSGYGTDGASSSTDTLSQTQDVRTAIIPEARGQSTLGRNRSVWAHKDAKTLRRFRRSHRMVTDKGDLILRLLRLRFDKEAARFVQTQLDLRAQQMQYEMRRAARRRT
ncbi:hypothetical protein H4R18_001771 [Coemansia javaensis]|uniref:MHD2 domain-containing protein n=1 Tax=Coemansia javaensis TaxID=2761396 RepID=A0A9W8HBS3_9FUNG|nr:hypothetical protein H4R18_001771 [Coemansia javaensis]